MNDSSGSLNSYSAVNLPSETWVHVCLTMDRDSATGIKMYFDGVDVGVTEDDASLQQLTFSGGSVGAYIGARDSGGSLANYFSGNIKNVALWTRVLTETEIQDVMYKTYPELSTANNVDLVSWWALDVDYDDSKGSNDGTNSGSTLNTDLYGGDTPKKPRALDSTPVTSHGTLYSGRALEFDGVTDYVSTGNTVGITDYPFTMSAWVKPETSTQDHFIVNLGDTNGTDIYYGLYWDTDGKFNAVSRNTTTRESQSGAYADGGWHYVVGVFSGDASRIVYVDGVAFTEDTNSVDFNTASDRLVIGKKADQSNEFFDGKITNVQIWDTAWSESDVQYAYTHPEKLVTDRQGGGIFGLASFNTSNLKAWYPLAEGGPTHGFTDIIHDASPKGALSGELATNGTFDTTVDSWVVEPDTDSTITWNAGVIDISRDGSGSAGKKCVTQEITGLTIGHRYRVSCDVTAVSNKASIDLAESATGSTTSATVQTLADITTPGYLEEDVIATATTLYICLGVRDASPATASFDNVSLRKIGVGNHATAEFSNDIINDDASADLDANYTVVYGSDSLVHDTDHYACGSDNDDSYYYQDFSPIAGYKYRMSSKIVNNNAVSDFDIRMAFFDGSSYVNGSVTTCLLYTSDAADE